MSKYLISAVVALSLLGAVAPSASADEGGGFRDFFRRFRSERESQQNEDRDRSGRQNDRDAKEQDGDLRDRLASRSQELRMKLKQKQDENRAGILLKFWNKAAERLRHVIGLESRLAERIRERLERSGRDAGEPLRLLGIAEESVTRARESLDDADAALRTMIEDGKPIADIVGRTRELHAGVIRSIRTAHRALVDVIVAMRGLAVGAPTPSLTPSATASPTDSPTPTP